MMLATTPSSALEIRFLDRCERLVNGLENTCDQYWLEFNRILDDATRRANRAMQRLITALPAAADPRLAQQGYVHFQGTQGVANRIRFFKDVAKIYAAWHRNILGDVEQPHYTRGHPAWEVSLGLFDHNAGMFLLKLRDEVIRDALELGRTLSLLDTDSPEESADSYSTFDEAYRRTRSHGLVSARLTGRGLPPGPRNHSRTTSIILRGLKGVVKDQEKALLENFMRGLDKLPRDHANKLYDATTGTPLRKELEKIADAFSTEQIDKRQLKLSVQTHIRAMVRRLSGEAYLHGKHLKTSNFILVPATRAKDKFSKEAYQIFSLPQYARKAKGGGMSLGRHPGDKLIPIPVPDHVYDKLKVEAAKRRSEYIKHHRMPQPTPEMLKALQPKRGKGRKS